MIILGVESSCDETAIALVENGRKVLSSEVASQIKTHERFGGVVPEIAAREHLKIILPLYEEAMRKSGCKPSDIDAIAVTQGPGLIGALLVGSSFAKGLAHSLSVPLVPVDHVHAHVHGALLGIDDSIDFEDKFPCLSLVISGGHSNLYYMSSPTHFEILAATKDDACGECFDKVAKMMGLPYPGGPHIERLATEGNVNSYPMPKMLANKSTMQFSYSGLKTHIHYILKNQSLSESDKANLCASFQEEALNQLARKILLAQKRFEPNLKSILVAGGVAANQRFRQILHKELGNKQQIFFPKLTYCADNGAMIAAYGWHEYLKRHKNEDFNEHTWDAYARYKFEQVLPQNSKEER